MELRVGCMGGGWGKVVYTNFFGKLERRNHLGT